MKNIKSEILIEFIEKGLPEIENQISLLKRELSDLETVTNRLSISKNITRDIDKAKEAVKTLNTQLNKLSSPKIDFSDFKSLETQFNLLTNNISNVKTATAEVDRLKVSILQTKEALVALNKVKLDNLKANLGGLNGKHISSLNKANNMSAGFGDLSELNKAISKQERFYLNLEKIDKEFKTIFTELSRGDKNSLGKIFDLKQLDKLKNEFATLREEAIKTSHITPLKSFVRDFKTLTNNWTASVKGNVKNMYDLQSIIKTLSREEDLYLSKTGKQTINATKNLERYISSLVNSTESKLYGLQQHLNTRKSWANERDIVKAKKLVEEYAKKLQKLQQIQEAVSRKASKGHMFSNEEIRATSSSVNILNRQFDRLNKRVRETKSALNETSGFKYLVNSARTALTYASLYGGMYQAVQVIKNAIAYTNEFNQSMKTFQAVLKLSEGSATSLETKLAHLGTVYGGTIQDINNASLALARAGVETKKVVSATEIVIKMAKLTGDSFETSANALITFMTVYRDSGASLQQLGDELAYVANQSKLSTEDINTFSNYALQTAKAVGVTRHYIEAMAIAFSNAGVRAETIGTSIRRLGTLATDNSTAVQNFFRKMGIAQSTFSYLLTRSSKDSARVMTELIRKLSRLSDEEFSKVTANMEILGKQSVTSLRENADTIIKEYQNLSEGVSGELDQANIATDSYIGTWEKLKNTFGETFNSLSQSLFPLLQKYGYDLIDLLKKAEAKMPQILDFLDTIKKTIEGISIVLASGAIISGISAISTGLVEAASAGTVLTTVIEGLSTAFEFLIANPIGALIALVGILGVGVYEIATSTDKVTKKIEKQNKILQQQLKIRKQMVEHDKKLLEYSKLKKQVMNELLAGDKGAYEKDIVKLNRLKQELDAEKAVINDLTKKQKILEQNKGIVEKYLKLKLVIADYESKKDYHTDKEIKAYQEARKQLKLYGQDVKNFVKNYKKYLDNQAKNTKKITKNQKSLFIITDGLVSKYSQWKNTLVKVNKEGVNTTKSIITYQKQLFNTINQGFASLKISSRNAFKDILQGKSIDKGINSQINTLFKKIDTAKSVKDITSVRLALVKLGISIEKITDDQQRKDLKKFLQAVEDSFSGIEKLSTKEFDKIKIPKKALEIKPVLNEKQLYNFKNRMNKALTALQEKNQQLMGLTANGVLPVENKLNRIYKERDRLNKTLLNTSNEKIAKQRKLYNTVKELKALEGSPKTVENETKLKNLMRKKRDLETSIVNLTKNENDLKAKIVTTSEAKLGLLKQQKLALISLKNTTAQNEGLSTFFSEFKRKIQETRTDIGLIDFKKDKQKTEAFFNWLKSELDNKAKELHNHKISLMSNVVGLTSGNTSSVDNLSSVAKQKEDTLQDLRQYYSEKQNLILSQQEELNQKRQAGDIGGVKYLKLNHKLKEDLERSHQERMKKIKEVNFNAQLGMARGFLTDSATIMEQLQQAGYLKNKKWFAVYKGLRVAQTIIDTYASAQKAMATLPYPINMAAAGMSIAMGMARLAVIKAQRFHTGGYVDRNKFNKQSMGGVRDDEIPTILQKGEYVLSKNDIAMIKQGSNPNVNVTANAPSPEVIIVNDVNDEKFANYLQSREGREIVTNIIH